MRVLWFCNTSSNAYPQKEISGGWISSLEEIISKNTEIELAISFENNNDSRFKFRGDLFKTQYYPIKRYAPNKLRKLYNNLFYKIDFISDTDKMLQVVNDFKPDLIQIFGSEDFFCRIIDKTNVPIVIHIQGILHKYLEKYIPKGISLLDLFKHSSIYHLLVGGGNFHGYYLLKKKAKRELEMTRKAKFFIGRTGWDKQVMLNVSPNSSYFHCEEAIRPEFFKSIWQTNIKEKGQLIIATTINDTVYKGFDCILKTALILKNKGFDFEWNVYGIKPNSSQINLFENILNIKSQLVNVNYKGQKTASELIENLLQSNIFMHPSHIDNSPNSVCEAMLLGIPVLAINTGGVNSLITNNVDGILGEEYDSEGIAEILINYNLDLAKRISTNCRLTALKRHNEKTISESLLSIYNNIYVFNK